MNKKVVSLALAAMMVLSVGLTSCSNSSKPAETKPAQTTKAAETSKAAETTKAPEKKDDAKKDGGKDAKAEAPKPGESGFAEIPIGKEQVAGPFTINAVYFQAVDMIPENKQPSAQESDMHLEADIHMTPDGGKLYGFGDGEDIWPAYLNVKYKVMRASDGKEVTSGVLMPMNADDGAHYGINIKKNVIPVGKYKLVLEIKPSDDYLLHVDPETGVPAAKDGGGKAAAEKYYQKITVTKDWNYDAKQLANK